MPLAKIGAVIPGGYTIKSTTLRGEKSDGMLCSETELEIGDDASGIMQLASGLALGTPLEEALNLGDTVLDVSITPNRSDCLSMIGIAREVAALTGGKFVCRLLTSWNRARTSPLCRRFPFLMPMFVRDTPPG